MEYVINVARPSTNRDRCYDGNVSYLHYFKAIVPDGRVKRVYTELKEKYPDYQIKVYAYETIKTEFNMDECNLYF